MVFFGKQQYVKEVCNRFKMTIKTLKHTDGREISLDMDANDISKLDNQLMLFA